MKKILVMLALLVIITGCQAIWDKKPEDTAYRLGRTTTIGYLLQKDKIDEDKVVAIQKAWAVYDMQINSIKESDVANFDGIVKAKLREYIKDDTQYMIACEMIDIYWKALQDKMKDKTDVEKIGVLLQFHDGVKSAMRDYQYLIKE